MPVAVHISPQHMTKQDYEAMISDLEAAGMSEPEGRLFHAAYGDDDVHMFEVWESPEQFKAHREQTLATLQASTLGPTRVEMHQVHSSHPD
ncbi:MAG: hypothetical protein WBQ18_04105 [Solirubrobacteraceae bacterium]